MTVAATRRASRISRGMVAASVRLAPTARVTAGPSWYALRGASVGSDAISLSDPRPQPPDHRRNGFALGACAEGERHTVFEHRLGEFDHIVDRGCEAAVEQRARAHG